MTAGANALRQDHGECGQSGLCWGEMRLKSWRRSSRSTGLCRPHLDFYRVRWNATWAEEWLDLILVSKCYSDCALEIDHQRARVWRSSCNPRRRWRVVREGSKVIRLLIYFGGYTDGLDVEMWENGHQVWWQDLGLSNWKDGVAIS